MQPKTSEVLSLIGNRGVVVGSFPKKGLDAKDVDVVIQERPEGRPPVFTDILNCWRDSCTSGVCGHIIVHASPLKVEIFEGILPLADDEKEPNRLTFRQAVRKSTVIDCLGVQMRAVV